MRRPSSKLVVCAAQVGEMISDQNANDQGEALFFEVMSLKALFPSEAFKTLSEGSLITPAGH
jgi:hypothetical protein